MKKNALYIQSGGPTSVISASAYGVIAECKKYGDINYIHMLERTFPKLWGI